MEISVVIPVLNEEENIEALHKEIVDVCEANNYKFEIIIVNDASTDNSAQVIKNVSPVKMIQFRKRYGQTAAMDAGIKAAQYPLIVTMDGDGQNDPADIPNLIHKLEKDNLDVVSGWRKDRKDPFGKRFFSKVANVLRGLLINDGIQDSGCSLKVYRKDCFDDVNLYGEMHRFIPAILKIHGFTVGEIVVNHRPRTAGITKYKWSRSVKGIIDMISIWFWKKYIIRPLHVMGAIGLFLVFVSFCCGVMTIKEFVSGQDMSDTLWLILTLFTFLIGLLIFISGLMMDIIIKTYFENSDRRYYTIKEVVQT